MFQPRQSRLSSSLLNPLDRQILPTGNGFGGSNLHLASAVGGDPLPENHLVFVVVSNSESIELRKSTSLIIEVGKIFGLALWLWCSIGVNFCLNSINEISTCWSSDVEGYQTRTKI